ncbi:DUF3794 and LysM peptidoglycan-binding domain-containing protein [Alkaliphilus serpentinus]|uniref:DUF3794 domain-containing protein n=1 Tax=Alkaliphilus serpentinus TaxID=1482731 RepID=A0A833HQX7_9FIRM|nr:SPOCS domain-containing protein [Alkaliphilus serpentinus]KAB3532487.1 DUF3794 domain-containing protein [Alkaliphilus serpentinus]
MPVELLKDTLATDITIAEDTAQAIIEGDILVPDIKPDISRVISVDGTIQVNKLEAGENKLTTEGSIKFKILYVSDRGDAALYSIDSSTAFKQTMNLEGMNNQTLAKVDAVIEHIDYTINNERKVGVKAVINLKATGKMKRQKEITREITGLEDIQVLRENFNYTEVIGQATSETLVKDTYELSEDLPGIREVINWRATAVERETKITDGKVIVGGIMNIELLYIADDYDGTLNIFKESIPFTHFVEIDRAQSDMKYLLKLEVPEVYTSIKENLQGEEKVLEVEAITKIGVKVINNITREFVVDAYSPSKKIKIKKDSIDFKENIGMNRSHVMLRETIDIPNSMPSIAKVFSASAKPILSDYSIVDDKAVIEGILEASIIYLAEEGDLPIYSIRQEVPFRHYVDVDGLKDNMSANIDLYTEEVTFEQINGQQVDIKINVGAACEGYLNKTIEVVNEILELEEEAVNTNKPSLTIYYIQPGDTLWKIAKKYRTTVERLMASNTLENSLNIKVGDYLLIEKVHHFKF